MIDYENITLMRSSLDFTTIPMDLIINGFNLEEVVLETIQNHMKSFDCHPEALAKEIKEALATKLLLKQGEK